MLVRNASISELEAALQVVNEKYENNIRFKRCEFVGFTRDKQQKWTVTLTVENSKAGGARWNVGKTRRVAAACWHVYGEFMDALPENTVIETTAGGSRLVTRPGDYWNDWLASRYPTVYISQLCECEDD